MTRRHPPVAPQRRPARRLARPALVAGLLAATAALTGCASHVDTVDPGDYVTRTDDGMYRVQNPYANPTAPVAVPYPDSCKSPPSMMGGPEDC